MRQQPNLDEDDLRGCLALDYGLDVAEIRFLPLGYDFEAAVYRVTTRRGADYFLKVHFASVDEMALRLPRALQDAGIENVLASLPTVGGHLCCSSRRSPSVRVVLYPFVRGENAVTAGLTAAQWRTFGTTMRAIHDVALGDDLRGGLRAETFGLPSAALVRRIDAVTNATAFSGVAERFTAFWRAEAARIRWLLARTEELGRSLGRRWFALVPCHADVHAANVLVGEDGRIWLIDWDGPMLAPRERDLLFVVGSRIARVVQRDEEAEFFAGYGPVAIDAEALVYYRYERIVEDLGEFGKSVLEDRDLSEEMRAEAATLAEGFFAPGGDIDAAEHMEFAAPSLVPRDHR